MLDYIRGRVTSKSPARLVLEVAGIGYLLHIPLSTFENIPSQGEVTILTQLFIREDQIKIFGFATVDERDLFQSLLSVNGIGPTLAITILSGSTVEDIKYAVSHEDAKALEKNQRSWEEDGREDYPGTQGHVKGYYTNYTSWQYPAKGAGI